MDLIEGTKMLVTTDHWFFAPDGNNYRAVFGTVKGIRKDDETLGIKTNKGSTNWYLEIGNMFIAGCQIHYAVKADSYDPRPYKRTLEHNGRLVVAPEDVSHIYNADE